MKIDQKFDFPTDVDRAINMQEKLRHKVIAEDQFGAIKYVAGVDVGYSNDDKITQAAVAVLNFPELELKEQAIAQRPTSFPYIPGLLSFREIPAILDALEKLNIIPDLLLCDGQGLIHPRRFGVACHLGVLVNIPSIGVAKSHYIGKHDVVGLEKGNWQPLIDEEEVIGAVLRSRTGVKQIYVSTGHKISLITAINYVLKCTPKYRLPETTRWADKLASNILIE
ncbi:endonuclease V [Hydrocoleum sp. CS-953]|uniref:deoxyribonuclease V n=1 Tax=Hydrocoleum sp. CS-953 TaxID=1671698 RepID=UPI000B9B13C0|nr:deoxyribonuclease V [Hydrocoleum sp. CS-953]OZH54608.1 endonuclease V [Hydrocoleum sp. CS-953]